MVYRGLGRTEGEVLSRHKNVFTEYTGCPKSVGPQTFSLIRNEMCFFLFQIHNGFESNSRRLNSAYTQVLHAKSKTYGAM